MAKLYEEWAIPVVSNQTDVEDPVVDRSLLSGFLSEKYWGHPEPKKFELTTQSLSKYKCSIDRRDGGWMLFQELLLVRSQMAEKHNVSISNVAVHDIADKPAVAAVIVGARISIAKHITSNQATFSFPGLDQGDVALIHGVVEKGDGIVDEEKPRFQPTKPQGIAKLERHVVLN